MEFFAILLFILAILGIKIDQEYQRGVIFRLGRFHKVKGPGVYWIIPFIDTRQSVDIRTNTVDIESQETVTKDSVTIKVNAVMYYKIIQPEQAIIAVRDYKAASYQAALTALRNIIGQHLLDEVLKDRDIINTAIRNIVDQITETWGLQIELVEMKDVELPINMQRAMAKEAEATRERRARIIKAESELEASLKLSQAAMEIAKNPVALELRRMQMITEVGAEQNTTTMIFIPSEFVAMANSIANLPTKNT
ncbi:membrane protein [Achromatium sp. WMS2]|nr:membrane protein [Achromatium sp. WMS2]